MGVERLAAIESIKLAIGEPIKYGGIVAGMYLLSLKDCELGKVARANYFFYATLTTILMREKKILTESCLMLWI